MTALSRKFWTALPKVYLKRLFRLIIVLVEFKKKSNLRIHPIKKVANYTYHSICFILMPRISFEIALKRGTGAGWSMLVNVNASEMGERTRRQFVD